MRKTIIAGILMSGIAASSPLFAQGNTEDVAQLKQRVAQLEKQVQEIARQKMPDLNAASLDAAIKSVKGTARSMGIEVTA